MTADVSTKLYGRPGRQRLTADNLNEVILWVDARLRTAEEQLDIQRAVTETILARGLQVIEDTLSPAVSIAETARAEAVAAAAEAKARAELGAILSATSPSSITVGTGERTFVIPAPARAAFAPAVWLAIWRTANHTIAMRGRTASYDPVSGTLVVEVTEAAGTGTWSDWSISVGNATDTLSDAVVAAQAAIDAGAYAEAASADRVLAQAARTVADAAAATSTAARDTTLGYRDNAATLMQRYLGAAAANPATRPGGGALEVGDWYLNTAAYAGEGEWRWWNGSGWRARTTPADSSVASFMGRVGAVVAQDGDYAAAEVAFDPTPAIAADDVQEAIETSHGSLATAIAALAADTATALAGKQASAANLATLAALASVTNLATLAGLAAVGDLAALEGLAATGIAVRTGTGTWATRTLAGPAAGISVANGDGVAANPTLSLANDLAAVEGLASTGIAVRTDADTWAQRQVSAPAAGITLTNPAGVAGNIGIVLANDLAALEGLAATGLAVRTADDTWAQRQVTAPAAGITVTNPAGVAGNIGLALANDLAALEGLAATGIAVRTGADTWAQRQVTAPVAGITVANPAGVAGDIALALANDLAAVEGLAATGIAVRTAADTWAQRSVAPGAGIAVANGNGVAGNPTVSLDINGLTEDTAPSTAADYVVAYSVAAGAPRKVRMSRAAAVPGQVFLFAAGSPPAGALKANGAAVAVATYDDLAAVIYCGDANNATAAWGYRTTSQASPSTNRSTTGAYIVLPNIAGEFLRGWDDGRGVDSGRSLWATQSDAIRNITGGLPQVWRNTSGAVSGAFAQVAGADNKASAGSSPSSATFDFDASRVVPTAAENRPRNIALLACIWY